MKKYIALMIAVLACWGCDTGTKYHFATYGDVRLDKTVRGASIPKFMPASARDIDGWYHVEMNEQTVEFTFAASDKEQMTMSLSHVQDPNSTCSSGGLMSRRWIGLDVRKSQRFEFYSRTAGKLTECLGIDIDQLRAYYWTVPRGA